MTLRVGQRTGVSNQVCVTGSPGPYAPTSTAHLKGLIGQMSSSPTDERLDPPEKNSPLIGESGGDAERRLLRRDAIDDDVVLDSDEMDPRERQGAGDEKAGCSHGFSNKGRRCARTLPP